MHVYIEKISDYQSEHLYQKLKKIFDLTDFWRKNKNKKTILIKPNLLGAYEPDRAVTTHPSVLEAIIVLLQEHGKEVWLGDSPGGSIQVQEVWKKTGISELCKKYSVRLLNFSETGIVQHATKPHLVTAKAFWDADGVINVAKYKTHSLMNYTGAMKNLYGIIPGLKKSDFHRSHPKQTDFNEVLTKLYQVAHKKVIFNVVDGIWGMEGEGPSAGVKRNFGVLFCSLSAAALDWKASHMMGFKDSQLTYIINGLQIENLNTGQISYSEKFNNFTFPDVKIRRIRFFVRVLSYAPNCLQSFFRKYFEYFPAIKENCKLCMVCKKSCPVQAISFNAENKVLQIDESKCIKCMCCHELCPHQAVYIKKTWLARMILK